MSYTYAILHEAHTIIFQELVIGNGVTDDVAFWQADAQLFEQGVPSAVRESHRMGESGQGTASASSDTLIVSTSRVSRI